MTESKNQARQENIPPWVTRWEYLKIGVVLLGGTATLLVVHYMAIAIIYVMLTQGVGVQTSMWVVAAAFILLEVAFISVVHIENVAQQYKDSDYGG
jgi:hypothetical protein